MTYRIDNGIPEKQLKIWLQNAAKKFGTFNDGRVDYTKADIAPIVMCTVMHADKMLLVKRGYGLADAEGYWSTINGFIDEIKPVKKQAQQEIQEELGLDVSVETIHVADSYTLSNPKEKRAYIVFPCLVELTKLPVIKLNQENTDSVWIARAELETYHILDDLPVAIDAALAITS